MAHISVFHAHSRRLVTDPVIIDEAVRVIISGLDAKQRIILISSMKSYSGVEVQSRCLFEADGNGQVDVENSPCLAGSYDGIDGMGFIWSMQPIVPGTRFAQARVDAAIKVRLQVAKWDRNDDVLDGHHQLEILSKTFFERTYLGLQCQRIPIHHGRLRATLFLPNRRKELGPWPGVIDLFGTGGGLCEFRAALLASHGFAALALAYFNYEDLPRMYSQIDLDYFWEAVEFLSAREEVQAGGIALVGVSKGAELALNMAAHFADRRLLNHEGKDVGRNGKEEGRKQSVPIAAVVAINGVMYTSSAIRYSGQDLHIFECDVTLSKAVDAPKVAGNELSPCFSMKPSWYPWFRGCDEHSRQVLSESGEDDDDKNEHLHSTAAKLAAIPIERMKNPILLITSGDDQNVPSVESAEYAVRRLREHGFRFPVFHLSFVGAGHLLEPPHSPHCAVSKVVMGGEGRGDGSGVEIFMMWGGQAKQHNEAQIRAWNEMLQFLNNAFNGRFSML